MFCKNCGNQIDETAKFCLSCGTPVEKGNAVTRNNIGAQGNCAGSSAESAGYYQQPQPTPESIPMESYLSVNQNQSGAYNPAASQSYTQPSQNYAPQQGNPQQNYNQQQNYAPSNIDTTKNFFQELLDDYLEIWKTFGKADGRVSKRKFWMTILAGVMVSIGLTIITEIIPVLSFVQWLYSLAYIVPSVCLGIRRLHDIGKEGSYYCMILIPIAGSIILLIKFLEDGHPTANQYGPVPSIK